MRYIWWWWIWWFLMNLGTDWDILIHQKYLFKKPWSICQKYIGGSEEIHLFLLFFLKNLNLGDTSWSLRNLLYIDFNGWSFQFLPLSRLWRNFAYLNATINKCWLICRIMNKWLQFHILSFRRIGMIWLR